LNKSRQTVNNVLCFTCYAAGPAKSSGTQTAWTCLLCHFGTPHTLALRRTFALPHTKSNHSRTYAKTGGWGLCYPHGNVPEICRRADILISGEQYRNSPKCRFQFRACCQLSTVYCELPFSPTTGNCCPTSRTRSHIYHYIKYPCRRTMSSNERRTQTARIMPLREK